MFKEDDNTFDVIVVGGGPGGLIAGKKSSESGLKTLILEKDQEIGSPVRCGEGITFNTFKKIGIKPKKEWYAQKIKGAFIYAPSGKKIVLDYNRYVGCVLERKMFEKGLAEDAINAGVKLLVKSTVTDLIKEKGLIRGVKVSSIEERQEFKSKIIIGADGVESKIGRLAGINTTNKLINVDSGLQYEMVGVDMEDPHMLEFYFGNDIAPRGYVWIFPKGKNRANVGVGIGGYEEKTAKYYLDKFVQSRDDLRNSSIIEVNGGSIPVGGLLKNVVTEGVMLIGDAAHQVNPMHGGGMEEAMVAAIMAANVAAKAIKKDDVSEKVLSEYNKIWMKERGNRLQKMQRAREFMEKLTDDDYNMLVKVLYSADLLEIINGNTKSLTKTFVKNPKLVGLIKKLI